jgi:hypothetical protein
MTATPSIDVPAWLVEQLSQANPDPAAADGPDFRGSVDVGRCRRGVRRRLGAAQPGPQQHPQRLSASWVGHPGRHYRPGHPQATGSDLLPGVAAGAASSGRVRSGQRGGHLLVDRPGEPATAAPSSGALAACCGQIGRLLPGRPQRPLRIGQQPFGLHGGRLGQLSVLAAHHIQRLLFAVALRVRSFAFRSWARRPAALDRFRSLVRTAPPGAWSRPPVASIRRTAFANSPESVGYATFDVTTVVSTRIRVQRSSFASAALASRASFNPSTAAEPHRVVNFINVVGCGTGWSSPIRQNCRQVIESDTSGHNDSNPNR